MQQNKAQYIMSNIIVRAMVLTATHVLSPAQVQQQLAVQPPANAHAQVREEG